MLEQVPPQKLPVRAPSQPLPRAQQFANSVRGEAGRGGAGFSSTLDMCPSSSSSQPQSLAHSLSHSPLPAFLPAGPPVSHDLSVCGSLASLRLAGDLSVWMECWNRYLDHNSLSELPPDIFDGLNSLTSLSVGRQGGRGLLFHPRYLHLHHPDNPNHSLTCHCMPVCLCLSLSPLSLSVCGLPTPGWRSVCLCGMLEQEPQKQPAAVSASEDLC